MLAATAGGATVYWNTTATPTYVNNPANWSPGSVPSTGDTAIIANGGTATIDSSNVFAGTLYELWVGNNGSDYNQGNGAVNQSGGMVNVSNDIQIGRSAGSYTGTYSMTGGTLSLLSPSPGAARITATSTSAAAARAR